jgi:hypothetical protein
MREVFTHYLSTNSFTLKDIESIETELTMDILIPRVASTGKLASYSEP